MSDQHGFLRDLDWETVKRGAYRQKSAIWALVYKEYKIKLGVSRIGLFWTLMEPVIGMLMISAVWYYAGRPTIQGTHITLFIGSGFIIFLTVRQGINYIPYAINANQPLLNYPQVKPIDTLIARFIQGMWLHALACIIMLLGLWWLGGIRPSFPDPLLCLEMVGTAMLLAMGLSLPIAVFGTLNESIFKAIGIFSQPLMILSGVMYSTYELPAIARDVLWWNPIVHLVEGFRAGAFGTKLFPEYEPFYPLLFGIFSLGFGYALYFVYRFRLMQK